MMESEEIHKHGSHHCELRHSPFIQDEERFETHWGKNKKKKKNLSRAQLSGVNVFSGLIATTLPLQLCFVPPGKTIFSWQRVSGWSL